MRVVRRTKTGKGGVIQAMKDVQERGVAGVAGQDPTIAGFMTWWIEEVKSIEVAASTVSEYRKRLTNRIAPYIGHVRLRRFTVLDGHQWMSKMEAAGLSAASRQAAHALLASGLKHAKAMKLITDSPLDHIKAPQTHAKTDDSLSAEEVEAVLRAARGDRLYALLDVSATLGMRQGEMLGLPIDGVDLEDGGLLAIDVAKTRAGVRAVPLVAGTRGVMVSHMELLALERAEPGYEDNGLIFCRVDGRPLTNRDLLDWWYRLQRKASVTPRRRWHALRHSAAQRMLDRGVPLEVVSAILGHAGLSITADVYGRAKADRIRKALADYDV